MRIALVGQPFERLPIPVESGSIRLWTHAVGRRLAQHHSIFSYARRHRGVPAIVRADGIEYRRIWGLSEPELLKRLRVGVGCEAVWPPAAWSWTYGTYFAQAALDIRRLKPDCVLIHNYSQAIPIIRALNPTAKIVLLMHCDWLRHWDQRKLRSRLSQADLLLGVSDWVSEGIRVRFPEYAHRAVTLYNGVDLDLFQPGAPRPPGKRLLFVGRISPEKGVHILIQAFQRVIERHPEAELEIIGPSAVIAREFMGSAKYDDVLSSVLPLCRSSYADELQSGTARHGRRIRFSGVVPHSRLPERYRNADLLVAPSTTHEGFGLPIVEAMAAGLPVIASASGGMPELVRNGVTGLVVPRNDAAALAEAICTLLDHSERRKDMGAAARLRANGFSWDRTAGAFLNTLAAKPREMVTETAP
jgi:glycosyltransferase involved in cell wall biosynthesis